MVDVQDIIAYEQGTLTRRQTLELFSELIRTGTAFELQGSYGRAAVWYLGSGYILPNGDITGAGLAVFGEDDEEEPVRYLYGAIDVDRELEPLYEEPASFYIDEEDNHGN
jgi:hypothetical protein